MKNRQSFITCFFQIMVGLMVAVVLIVGYGCSDSSGLFGGSRWRAFDEKPTSARPSVTPAAKPAPVPQNASKENAPIAAKPAPQSNDPQARHAEVQVNEQVSRMNQALQNRKANPKPRIDDSDSLAAKLAPEPATPSPTPVPPSQILSAEPKTERPVITPAHPTSSTTKPADGSRSGKYSAIKITRVEPLGAPSPTKTDSPTNASRPPVTPTPAESVKPSAVNPRPTVEPLPAASEVSGTSPETKPAEPSPTANTAAKVDIPETENPSAALESLLFQLEQKIKDRPRDTGTQVKLRLIYAILGQWQQAMKDKTADSSASGEMAKSLVAIVRVFENPDESPAVQANQALVLVEKMQDLLRKQADLVISSLQLCREVNSFGSFKLMPSDYFVAGKALPVIIYLELENFTSKYIPEKKIYQTLLSLTLEVADATGRVRWRQRYEQVEDPSAKRRRDFFLAPSITLPASLPAGSLKVKVTVEDLNGNKVAQRMIDLEMKSR